MVTLSLTGQSVCPCGGVWELGVMRTIGACPPGTCALEKEALTQGLSVGTGEPRYATFIRWTPLRLAHTYFDTDPLYTIGFSVFDRPYLAATMAGEPGTPAGG